MRDHKGLNEIASIIRKEIVTMIHGAKSGHPGGSLSSADIVTTLFFKEMNIDPSNPKKIQIEIDSYYQKVMRHQFYIVL